MRIQEYTTATGKSSGELDRNVRTLLNDGFELYGNPYFISHFDAPFCQAMVKGSPAEKQPGSPVINRPPIPN